MSNRKRASRLLAYARAAAVLLMVTLGGFGLGLRVARATLGERLLGFGSQLSRWQGFRLTTAPRTVSVNGAELNMVVASSSLPLRVALDRIEAVCDQAGGIDGAKLVPKLLREASPVNQSWLKGHVRQESEHEGVIACLDTGGPLALGELTARLHAFAQSGDLNNVGAFRYATARRTGNVTTVLLIWVDGPLPLRVMFPRHGDAPGVDPAAVPRPPGSVRLLSGIEHGAPYSLTAYRTQAATPERLLAWYRPTLRAAGFVVEDAKHGILIARQGSGTLLIQASSTHQGVTAAIGELK